METELLLVPECPNGDGATAVLRAALDDVGLTRTAIHTTVISTHDEAVARGFVGSPTILLDGKDPFAQPGQTPALACRVYATPNGLSGVPSLEQLREAVHHAAS